ncbi:cytochrome P450 monooxygenase [Mycena crocata]|nr:cytochrome P450 monooxygenase [Mycena crocata]
MISQLTASLAGTIFCCTVIQTMCYVYRTLSSSLRHVDGPRNRSWFLGNFKEMADDPYQTDKWRDEFGAIFLFKGLLNRSELHMADTKAINHILTNTAVYQRPPFHRNAVTRLLGRGLLTTELEVHHRHRRILNPAFGGAQIRDLTEIFMEKSIQLRDVWSLEIAQATGPARLDVLIWLRRITLDIIGEAGFGYQFNALKPNGAADELNDAFTQLLHGPHTSVYGAIRAIQGMFPILRFLPLPGGNIARIATQNMMSVGAKIVADRKAEIQASEGPKGIPSGRDLLSVLLKANMAPDLPENQRLSDSEVIAQIPSFFSAGHETTSLTASWTLHALSLNTAAQDKLREELRTVATETPTMDELNSLPYLENVVRETLRLYVPLVSVDRTAMKEDVLPLSKPYIDTAGKSHNTLLLLKGQLVHIPIQAVNIDPEIWGSDAAEFKPERWENIPAAVSAVPGVWGSVLTFLAGPHNCIGFRFAVVELKALIFTLIRAFQFENAVPAGGIGHSSGVLQRPVVFAETKSTSGLPLIVQAIDRQL